MADLKEQIGEVQWQRACILSGQWVRQSASCPPVGDRDALRKMFEFLAPAPAGELVVKRHGDGWMIAMRDGVAPVHSTLDGAIVSAVLRWGGAA